MESRKRPEFTLTADACIISALALLILPLKWIAAAAAAAVFHECCHILALRMCSVQIYRFAIGAAGAVIETEPMGEKQELFCALAGPMGSLLLVLLIRIFPELAICGGIQGLFNLLPIFPLDGGRVVKSVLNLVCPGGQERIMNSLSGIVALAFLFFGLLGFFRLNLGFGVLIPTFLLIRKGLGRKIPCKEARKGVQ